MSADTTAAKTTTCRLLELPAELRNRIYRYALVEEKVRIEAHTFSQPSLLKTCRQIRSEAKAIYYLGNEFQVRADNFDHRLMAAFYQQAGENRYCTRPEMSISANIRHDSSSWENLLNWFAAFKKDEVVSLACYQICNSHACCKAAAVSGYELIDRLPCSLSWEQIKPALAILRETTEQQAMGRRKWT